MSWKKWKDMSVVQLREERKTSQTWIDSDANDGRLSVSSSATLDMYGDFIEEIDAELKNRGLRPEPMFGFEYIQSVKRSESPHFDACMNQRILHGAMGVCTEAGEIMDAVKKSLFYNRVLDRANLIEEMGDAFWYLALMADELGVSFEEIWERNINKLKLRYPEQFTPEAAQNRDIAKERTALE
jgi:NTP pyrophosphatase (non-canonical NTP hydrolase)